MSQNCDACVELESHEMSAIQGVVVVSFGAPVVSSSEKCTIAPLVTPLLFSPTNWYDIVWKSSPGKFGLGRKELAPGIASGGGLAN